jgi:hypothetical protein
MQGYCEKVNTLLNDRFYFSIADGNLQFHRDSTKSKLVDCIVLNNKTAIKDKGDKSLELANIFMESGSNVPKYVMKFDDANIRSEWRHAIEAACRPATTSASKPPPPTASLRAAPAAARDQSSQKSAKGQSSQDDSQPHLDALHRMQERMDVLERKGELLVAQRKELDRQLHVLCQNGGRELPANKPKICRLMKDIKAKAQTLSAIDGMKSRLNDQCTLIDQFITMRDSNQDFQIDPQMRAEMAKVNKDLQKTTDFQAELQEEWQDMQDTLAGGEQDIDDDELNRQLEEITGSTSASAALDPLPALSLPAAGKKAVPTAARGASSHAVQDDDDELERIRCSM